MRNAFVTDNTIFFENISKKQEPNNPKTSKPHNPKASKPQNLKTLKPYKITSKINPLKLSLDSLAGTMQIHTNLRLRKSKDFSNLSKRPVLRLTQFQYRALHLRQTIYEPLQELPLLLIFETMQRSPSTHRTIALYIERKIIPTRPLGVVQRLVATDSHRHSLKRRHPVPFVTPAPQLQESLLNRVLSLRAIHCDTKGKPEELVLHG